MKIKSFYDSLTPFWFTTNQKGIVLDYSKYFSDKLSKDYHFDRYFALKNVFIKDTNNIYGSLQGKTFRLLNEKEPSFRVTAHEHGEEILFSMWPILKTLGEVKSFNLSKELSHPASVISDIIIAKDMYLKNFKELSEMQKLKFDREKLEQFSNIISSTPSTLTIINDKSELIYINQRGINILEAENIEEALSIDLRKIISPEHYDEVIKFHNLICNGETATFKYKIKTLKDSERWIESYSAPYKLSDGSIAHIAISNDITIKRRQELDRLREKELTFHKLKLASLGELAAGVGHEINNPLAIISGNLEILRFKVKGGKNSIEETTPNMNKISNALDRINKIVKGLKNFSRSDSEKMKTINLSEVINESIDMVKEIYEKIGLNVISNISQSIYITGNSGRIQQVLINLLNNSKDAMANKNGNITISLSSINNKVYLSIKDEGCGIKKEIADRVFDPFFTTKAVNQGTGIGLSICHQIIQEHNGNISIEESNKNGTTFLIKLDQVNTSPLEDNSSNKIKKTLKTTNKSIQKILVADDEPSIREIISLMLTENEYHVTCVEDGLEAWQRLQDEKYDILITDIQMPNLNGHELLRKLDNEKTQKLYKIVLTGGTSLSFSKNDNSLNNNIDAILEKPFKKEQLIQIIDKIKRDDN